MAKLVRQKDGSYKAGYEINIETGDVVKVTSEPWPLSLTNAFVKCCSLVDQISEKKHNIVDEANIVPIAYSLVPFGEKGNNLFKRITLFQTIYDTQQLDDLWEEASRRSTKRPTVFIRLCKELGYEAKTNEDEGWEYKLKDPGKTPYHFTDGLTETQVAEIQNFGFIERSNCYYFAEFNAESKICTLVRKSNFVLRILFHINRGKQNKRVIEILNNKGRKVTTDIETNQLASFQKFKELTEGSGNFIFEGTQIDLTRIKNKLFEQELPSQQIDMLGWNKQGKFFAFANGLFDKEFHPVDEHGIVTLNEKNYFIPYHPGTDEYTSINEKLFSYKPGAVSFTDWAELYCKAFGDTGRVAMLFGIATLFSDHVFAVRRNFPMLFLYGEGGSGKSRVGVYLQYLWGEPQPPLKLSDRANTDKARIRKMAQYINVVAMFEEFINELEMNVIKTITGIYDRFGYERSNINSMYGTETVPINSTAFITGNSYPNDDPLMQRIILIDYNKNVRDEKTVEAYNRLTQINRGGITHLTGWLLQYRSFFIEHYENEFDTRFAEFKQLCSQEKIIVPDRMCENYALVIAVYEVMNSAGVKLPFMPGELKKFLLSTIRAQADKRDVGSVTQRFWDIIQQLASEPGPGGKPIIKEGKEYKIDGNRLFIRWTELHGLYLEKHQKLYRTAGLGKSTMLQKLRDGGHMISNGNDREWVGGKTCAGYWFEYDKLGIDLIDVASYWQAHERRYTPNEESKGKEGNFGNKEPDSAKASTNAENDDPPF